MLASHSARRAPGFALIFVPLLFACSANPPTPDTGVCDRCIVDSGNADAVADAIPADVGATCTTATCPAAGSSCRTGVCTEDCRPGNANACPAATVCDFTDGHCRATNAACVLPAAFESCPSASGGMTRQCGPGLTCDGDGSCIVTAGCSGLECDETGRCWARACPCDRPAPRCNAAPLAMLNQPEFTGSLVNGHDTEGAFDLGFDDLCNAYAVTEISGPDYLRQITPAGVLTQWQSTTNLNMGEVAVLRLPGGELTASLGDIAATYICCATCGCVETGADGRLGVIRLDRTSTARPLPNVLAAMPTSGTGPFGNPGVDTGPYGLTWGGDRALYVGNVMTNGDFMRVDLATGHSRLVAMFPARVVASTLYDLRRLLVATAGGQVYRLEIATGMFTPWAVLPGDPTKLARDGFSGRVYAEVRTATPEIFSYASDGTGMAHFQTPPRIGRIAIAPDGFLYHLSVYPMVNWMARTSIVRWPLPAQR